MEVIIQSLGFKASDQLEDFIREKLQKIKSDKIIRALVTLFKGPSSNVDSSYCEIRIEVPGNDHFVKRHTEHFETSVSECVSVLTKVINKAKEKSDY